MMGRVFPAMRTRVWGGNVALLLVLSEVSLGASPCLTGDGPVLELQTGDTMLGKVDLLRKLAVLYSEDPSIWSATTWREIAPDRIAVTRSGHRVCALVPSFGGLPIRLEARFEPSPDRSIVVQVRLWNRSPGVVVGLRGPGLSSVANLPGGALLIPNRPGHRLANPWLHYSSQPVSMEYPVPASMQYMAYVGDESGVALHVRDKAMVYKHFIFAGPDREMTVLQYPFVTPGGRWQSPPIMLQALDSWRQAADLYREWFESWASAPRISPVVRAMPTLPGTVIKARPIDDPYLKDVTKAQEVHTFAAALEQARGYHSSGLDGVHLVGWFGQGHDTTYPDHRPAEEMGGESGLIEYIRALHGMDMLAVLYLNARLANVMSPTYLAHPDWRALTQTGLPREERLGGETFHVMCPGCRGYQDHLIAEVRRVAETYRGDGVQLDQIGAAWSVLCFDQSHGHRTPATAWAEGHTALLRRLRAMLEGVNPDFLLWIEGAWEGAGQYVDLSQGGFWPDLPGAEYYPRLYRYTLPEHPLFGDARMGGVPYWGVTDLGRNRAINDQVGRIFWEGTFMDDQGLVLTPAAEGYWFLADNEAVITVVNDSSVPVRYLVTLDPCPHLKGRMPQSARAVAAGQSLAPVMWEGHVVFELTVPQRQMEAAHLQW